MVWMLGGFYSTVYIYIYLSIYIYLYIYSTFLCPVVFPTWSVILWCYDRSKLVKAKPSLQLAPGKFQLFYNCSPTLHR
jgi:hypothetical protein